MRCAFFVFMIVTPDQTPTPSEGYTETTNPLELKIEDTKLANYVDRRIRRSDEYYDKTIHLKDRQKKNENYYFGRQINESLLKPYNARYMDNLIYEAQSTIKPIALSRLPDLYITDANNDPNVDNARKLTNHINSEIRQRELRRTLAIAFKHIPVGFIGAIKHRWNPAKGKYGDYEFYPVHYSKLTLDHTAKSNDTNDMDYIAEMVEMPLQEVILRFPDMKDQLMEELKFDPSTTEESKMATPINLHEVWFKWYEDAGNGETTLVSAVLWKYKKLILKKIKNPNWDWEGEQLTFTFKIGDDGKKTSKLAQVSDYQQMMTDPNSIQTEEQTAYKNYYEQPEFPYILMGYDQFAKMPYDETSAIEQSIYLQDNINKRGKQITEIADRAKGKHIFSDISGLTADDIGELDMDDPDLDILVKGRVSDSHAFIPGEQPGQALYQDQEINRNRLFEKMGVNATTRGVKETDTATTAQILRESDFGRIDDMVEDTINYAAEKIGCAVLQYIKLRYTEEHLKYALGKDGEVTYQALHSDMVDPDMKVIVHASGVDKMLRKKEAYEKAKMQLIDPLTFYEDTDSPNPKERASMLLDFMRGKQDGWATYETKWIKGLDTTQKQADALNGMNAQATGSQDQGAQQATMDIQLLQQGQQPNPPQPMTPAYLQAFEQFIQSPEFSQLQLQIQQLIISYVKQLADSALQGQGQTTPVAQPPKAMPPASPQPAASPMPQPAQV